MTDPRGALRLTPAKNRAERSPLVCAQLDQQKRPPDAAEM
jgi:hypothetical protein